MQLKSARGIPVVGDTRAVKFLQCSFDASLFSFYFFYIVVFINSLEFGKTLEKVLHWCEERVKNSHPLYRQSEKFSFHEERSRHQDECAELNI